MMLYTDRLDRGGTRVGRGLRMGFRQPSQRPEASHLLQEQQQIRKGTEASSLHILLLFHAIVWICILKRSIQPVVCCRNRLVRWQSKSTGSSCWGRSRESTRCYRRARVARTGTWRSSSSGQTNDDGQYIYRIRCPVVSFTYIKVKSGFHPLPNALPCLCIGVNSRQRKSFCCTAFLWDVNTWDQLGFFVYWL